MRPRIVGRGEAEASFILVLSCFPPNLRPLLTASLTTPRTLRYRRTSIGHLGAPFNPGGKGPPVVHGQVGISFGITEAARGSRARTQRDALIRPCLEICPARPCSFPVRLRENAAFSVLRTLMFHQASLFLSLYIGRCVKTRASTSRRPKMNFRSSLDVIIRVTYPRKYKLSKLIRLMNTSMRQIAA